MSCSNLIPSCWACSPWMCSCSAHCCRLPAVQGKHQEVFAHALVAAWAGFWAFRWCFAAQSLPNDLLPNELHVKALHLYFELVLIQVISVYGERIQAQLSINPTPLQYQSTHVATNQGTLSISPYSWSWSRHSRPSIFTVSVPQYHISQL